MKTIATVLPLLLALAGCEGQELARASAPLVFSLVESESLLSTEFVAEAQLTIGVNAAARVHQSVLSLRIDDVPDGTSATVSLGPEDNRDAVATGNASNGSISLSVSPNFASCSPPVFADTGDGCTTELSVSVALPSTRDLYGTALLRVVTSDETIDASGFSATIGAETADAGVDDAGVDDAGTSDAGADDAGTSDAGARE